MSSTRDFYNEHIISNGAVKFSALGLNRSGEIRLQVVRDCIFHVVFVITSALEVTSAAISGVIIAAVDVDVYIGFGDSRSNRS